MNKGILLLCPPKEGLSLLNYELIYPNRLFGFMIEEVFSYNGALDINELQVKRI
jgi:hypothetical protein